MSTEALRLITERLGEGISSGMKVTRSLLFPNDFEFYMCALELTTFDGDVIDYFAFPIMPNSIQKSEINYTSKYVTFGGVTILNSDTFTGGRLVLSGNFGRSFRFLIRGGEWLSFKGLSFSMKSGIKRKNQINSKLKDISPDFHPDVKSGYGCIKILQSIIDKSKGHDNGKPFRLYFHNPALGESYLVVALKEPLNLSQEVTSSNMIWNYQLSLEIIADTRDLVSKDDGQNRFVTMTSSVVQDMVQGVSRDAIKLGTSLVKKQIINYRRK
jgi:hypothetical protein